MKRGSVIWTISAMLILMVQGIAFTAHATTYRITDLGDGVARGINELGQVTGVSGGSAYIYDSGVFGWIDPPGPGTIFPMDINIDGEVVGRYNYVGDYVFLFDGSESINLGRFGGEIAYGQSINNSGQIVGAYKPSGSGMRAFVYSNGSFQDLGLLGTTGYSIATAINSHGEIAGQSTGISGVDRAFFYDGSTMQDLGTLGFEPSSRRSYGTDINDAGHVVGWAQNSSYKYRAFLWDGNQMNDLGTLGGTSKAYAINSADVVVGSFVLSDTGPEHAFVHDGTQMLDLNDLLTGGTGWVLTNATDINSNGWIVGYGDLDGEQHGFLLTPEDTPTVIEVAVETDNGRLLEGIKVYAFTGSGAYTGLNATTDETGKAQFKLEDLEDGIYQFRVDYLQQQFWSGYVDIPGQSSVTVTIDEADVPVNVTTGAIPLEQIRVYLFSGAGAYLGVYSVTDQNGAVHYALPVGMNVLFRADYLGYQFWSEGVTVLENTQVDLAIPHEILALTVQGAYQGVFGPIEGLNVYLFNSAGSYMGIKEVTDADGRVAFDLNGKSYRARADYLGQQFWSGDFISENTAISIPMANAQVAVTNSGAAIAGVPVYVFSQTGAYLGIHDTTTADGAPVFKLPAGIYKFRADYQGNQYWSAETALMADAVSPVVVSTGGGTFELNVLKAPVKPIENVKCYLFNEAGAYLGESRTSDWQGAVSFSLADGRYKIRADYKGAQFWSDVFEIPTVASGDLMIPHAPVTLTVQTDPEGILNPPSGISVYLFTASKAYLGEKQVTDENGQVVFDLPQQPYMFRADYLGKQYWSDVLNGEDGAITIQMADVALTVTSAGGTLPNVKVYVFSATGSYLGINKTTDADGNAAFRLPVGGYKFRADYQGSQYWSNITPIAFDQVNEVDISSGGGRLEFTVSKDASSPLEGIKCYVFNERNSYLGIYAITDSLGRVNFDLAAGRFKIRVDYVGYQFWSDVYEVPDTLSDVFTIPHQDVTVTAVGGGPEQVPMPGLKVYLFTPAGAYLGKSGVTDALGQVVFNLPDQSYKVRVDSLGQQYWSDVFQSQDTIVFVD